MLNSLGNMLVSTAIQEWHEYYGLPDNTAPLTPLLDGDVVLDDMIQSFGPNSGVMLAESTGWDSDAVALKVYLDGAEAFRCRLPIRTRPVRWMYRWINSRHLSGEGETRPTNISLPDNAPYGVDSMKKLVFLHGANVSESDDRNAESFRVGAQKRVATRGSSSSVRAEEGGAGR